MEWRWDVLRVFGDDVNPSTVMAVNTSGRQVDDFIVDCLACGIAAIRMFYCFYKCILELIML